MKFKIVATLALLILSGILIKPYVLNDRNDPETASTSDQNNAEDCRLVAPEDPYIDDKQGGERAYAACAKAVERSPNDAETLYLFGVSALQSDRPAEAAEAFRKAADLGYCKAVSFLGDEAWYGQKDAKTAQDYYERGRSCGDGRAADELFSPAVFSNSLHQRELESLYRGDIATLNEIRFARASYIAGFYEALSEQYLGKEFDPCWTAKLYRGGEFLYGLRAAEKGDASNIIESFAYENGLPIVFQVMLPEQGSTALTEFRESERRAGHADLIRLVESSKCDALLPYKIVKGIEEFAKSKKSLLEVVQKSAPQVRSQEDLLAWLRQKNQQRPASHAVREIEE